MLLLTTGTGLDDDGAVELISALGKCPNLTTLDLNGFAILFVLFDGPRFFVSAML